MKNLVADGNIIPLIAPYTLLSGQGLLVGMIFGIAQYDAAIGIEVEALVEGVVTINKIGSQAWTQGAAVYWDNTNRRATTVATGNKFIGYCTTAVAGGAGDTAGNIKLALGKDVVG